MSNSDIILFDKEEGITSFSSLYSIKRCYAKGTKVGHAGTLDKFASGLMIVLIGNATRLNPVFSSFDKSYIATIRFGEESDTLDPEGRIIKTSDLPSLEEVLYALDKIKGKSLQAFKRNGRILARRRKEQNAAKNLRYGLPVKGRARTASRAA